MGPLAGVRVVELAGLGALPFAGMLLADLGAEVVKVDRPGGGFALFDADPAQPSRDPLHRGRPSVAVDLKHPDGVAAVLRLVEQADVLVEGFRPGVAERLGVGPDACCARNPRLVYGRLTGWGQDGPLASAAGHDVDYIAVAGALDLVGREGQAPVPPVNLLGDFAGGGMLLVLGVLAALVERAASGRGQVVDAAMVDGAALLAAPFAAGRALGMWGPRGTNPLDTGAPFYDVYECADGRHVAVGALEPQFWSALVEALDLGEVPDQWDRAAWPALRARLAAAFATRTRDEWAALLGGTDACVAPVLGPDEAAAHPHAVARGAFADVDGVPQPAPAPRFARTPAALGRPPSHPGADTDEVLAAWGFTADEVAALRASGAVA